MERYVSFNPIEENEMLENPFPHLHSLIPTLCANLGDLYPHKKTTSKMLSKMPRAKFLVKNLDALPPKLIILTRIMDGYRWMLIMWVGSVNAMFVEKWRISQSIVQGKK